MKIIRNPAKETWANLLCRPAPAYKSVRKVVKDILDEVKKDGDKAVRKFENKFSSRDDSNFNLTEELKESIQLAKENIEKFHRAQLTEPRVIEVMPGIHCWRKQVPIETVGLYIPGGSAPLFSTVLMLGVPAALAGCKNIILCTPSLHPAVIYAAGLCGIKNIFPIGGAQAIAAMAYGTKTVPKVAKIFGPGNAYVTTAKQLVQTEGVAIDMPAGPSELLIIADDLADARFIAADLLSQAEHGTDSQVILLTTSEKLIEEVKHELSLQLETLPRKDIAIVALINSKIILVNSLEEATEISNSYAPEHLILACREISDHVINAGSVFIGNYSPEAAGDYASGTNHVLPTGGYASAYSGISVESFMKIISFQLISKTGLQNLSKTVITMAAAEGLEAHKKAIEIRL